MRCGTYIVNLDDPKSVGTNWIVSIDRNLTKFNTFGVEHISEEIKRFIDNKNFMTNIFRI